GLCLLAVCCVFFFFFQAEDGIRDWSVTGVQTCALPIFQGFHDAPFAAQMFGGAGREYRWKYGTKRETFAKISSKARKHAANNPRSEERRVGKGGEVGGRRMNKKKRRRESREQENGARQC